MNREATGAVGEVGGATAGVAVSAEKPIAATRSHPEFFWTVLKMMRTKFTNAIASNHINPAGTRI